MPSLRLFFVFLTFLLGEVTHVHPSSLVKASTIEPRSDAFKEMLVKLSKSMKFLIQHTEIKGMDYRPFLPCRYEYSPNKTLVF